MSDHEVNRPSGSQPSTADVHESELPQSVLASLMTPLRELIQAEIRAALPGPSATSGHQNPPRPQESSIGDNTGQTRVPNRSSTREPCGGLSVIIAKNFLYRCIYL